MLTFTLAILPGVGSRTVEIAAGATVQDLIVQENLHGLSLIINGETVDLRQAAEATLDDSVVEVFAVQPVKGA